MQNFSVATEQLREGTDLKARQLVRYFYDISRSLTDHAIIESRAVSR